VELRDAGLGHAERPGDVLERDALEVVERDDHALTLRQAVQGAHELAAALGGQKLGARFGVGVGDGVGGRAVAVV
jgi:hypothetical protein